MYSLYFAPTANGHKILIMLEALGVPYRIHRITLRGNSPYRSGHKKALTRSGLFVGPVG